MSDRVSWNLPNWDVYTDNFASSGTPMVNWAEAVKIENLNQRKTNPFFI